MIARLVGVALLCGCSSSTPEPTAGERAAASFLAAIPPAPTSLSPDGRRLLLVSADGDGFRVHLRAAALAEDERVVALRDAPVGIRWSPDNRRVAFMADRGGDQQYRLHILDADTGEVQRVRGVTTPIARLRWRPDGGALAVAHRAPGGAVVQRVEPATGAVRDLGIRVGGDAVFEWSPDGATIASVPARSNGVVALTAVAGGASRRIAITDSGFVTWLAFSDDGGTLVASARAARDEHYAVYTAAIDGTAAQRAVSASDADLRWPRMTPDGRRLLYHSDRGGVVQLHSADLDGRNPTALSPADGTTYFAGFHGDAVRAFRTAETAPPELGEIDPSTARYRRLGAAGADSPAPERLRLGGERVPAYLWRTSAPEPSLVIVVHGGPRMRLSPAWSETVQLAVSTGYHVMRLNYRGSTGYGASFARAGDRAAQLDDLAVARAYAAELGVPPARVVLVGESYGALLALESAVRDPSLGAVVMVAPLARDVGRSTARPGPRLIAFSGARDKLAGRSEVRTAVAAAFGDRRLAFHRLADEGHHIRRLPSRARIYGALSDLRRR